MKTIPALHKDTAYIAEVEKLRTLKQKVNELDRLEAEMHAALRPIRGSTSNADIVANALAIANGDSKQVASAVDLQRLNNERNELIRGITAQEQIITDLERSLSQRAAKALVPELREIIAKQHRSAQALALHCALEDEKRREFEQAGYRLSALPRIGIFNASESQDFIDRDKRYVADAEEQLRINGLLSDDKAKSKAA